MPEKLSQQPAESGLIRDLLARLDEEEIVYCHWKSNWRIDRWLRGEGDLDLLVRRQDIARFTAALSQLAFKRATVPMKNELPGIANYFGLDEETGNFVHIHAHYQLVFGHDLTKNYRLPIEETFLRSSVRQGEIYVPLPEMELIIFAIRMVLKYSWPEAAMRFALGRLKDHVETVSEELNYLESRSDELKVRDLLHSHFPMLDRLLFKECRASLRGDMSVRKRLLVRRKLEKALSPYARMSRFGEATVRLRGRILWPIEKLAKKRNRKKLECGGALIAIVGGDGAGKTTCANEIQRWLSREFENSRAHLGKPPKSILTMVAGAALKAERKLQGIFGKPDEFREAHASSRLLLHLRWVCTARDRFRLYKNIRRSAARGEIVICDRYPVPSLRLMDSAKIDSDMLEHPRIDVSTILGRIENWYYRRILPPDLMLVLRVEPNTAVTRKTDESPDHVYSRSKALWDFNWQNVQGVRLIDAGRPLAEVTADLRCSIWQAL